jgi:3-isopropylmalate/(R)-2-methylmalate dehydratase small subunit
MKHGIDVIAQHCLEAVRPEFAAACGRRRAGGRPNFGIGSSREQAAAVLVHLGVAAVIAPSFSGLYFRNAFNLGLLLLTCAEADSLQDGDRIALDTRTPALRTTDARTLACEPVPAFLTDMVEAGGLLPLLRRRMAAKKEADAH